MVFYPIHRILFIYDNSEIFSRMRKIPSLGILNDFFFIGSHNPPFIYY